MDGVRGAARGRGPRNGTIGILRWGVILFLTVATGLLVGGGPEALRALWPSATALILVFVFRKVIVGLLAGGLAGALLLTGGNAVEAGRVIGGDILIPAFGNSWKLSALLFTLLLGGFAALLERGKGLETWMVRNLVRGRGDPARKLQKLSMGLGLVCFFDGLANSILLGRVTRSLARTCGVSREKMAYLVDSTSSSVACIAFISTWIAFQLSLIGDALEAAGYAASPYLLFFASIPKNYYALYTLIFLFVVIVFNFHLGPMRRLEVEARNRAGGDFMDEKGGEGRVRSYRALIPLFGLVFSIMSLFYFFYAFEHPDADWSTAATYGLAFSTGFGPEAMVGGTLLGILLAFLFYPHADGDPAIRVFLSGVRALLVPILILISAWILGGVLSALGTAETFTALLEGRLPLAWVAPVVFLTGALISFSTGTSWGTMAILMPLSIPAVLTLGAGAVSPEGMGSHLSLVIAAVFSGAVFGDHCSPFSDTTIVSSIACGVEPEEHVRTQLPFALVAGGAAIVLGFVPAGYGISTVWILPVGIAFLLALPFLFPKARQMGDSGDRG